MIKIYGIKNCDSVKKALSFFKKHNLKYELQDFKTDKVGYEKISDWLLHVEMKTLFNSRSTTYRTLNLKELDPDDNAKTELLCKENLLIKRPVIEFNNKVLVGYNETEYIKELL
ncbi:Spx/MgsR family RNA polymerase-binding regulatory protein [Candidatus Sulfurimonas marisnigri]|uniref:Spx/MgsR family RNA polymerase-binding regulatory protein n=1 Tax=Candidatus Sulfurimonas marisnigri TaxID=2740405 RepID=A0A7S7LYG6_9BACT|nr:arsenate reductase family protein [Candidatus Sulfurimonas marisnigri]QOY53761.1 Spx/MgsR family RNA polymerase-binding regulatory protein [Candidatus Sulfurimonas marisnigri]